jgi:hypothetical protein
VPNPRSSSRKRKRWNRPLAPMPAVRVVDEARLAAAVDNLPPLPEPPVKRRGRPPGARNKPKLDRHQPPQG